jgi:hypothetical protein
MTNGRVPAGLCDSCRWQRLVATRTSVFSLCRRSNTDSLFPRYPTLPVMRCSGYEEKRQDSQDSQDRQV